MFAFLQYENCLFAIIFYKIKGIKNVIGIVQFVLLVY